MEATTERKTTWRDNWVWVSLAGFVVAAVVWVGYDNWADGKREEDRRTTEYVCAIEPTHPDC